MGSRWIAWGAGSILLVCLAACGGGGGGTAPAEMSSDASLLSLSVSSGTLSPSFDPTETAYTVGPALLPDAVTFVPVTSDAAASVTVNGAGVNSGTDSQPVGCAMGTTTVEVRVTAEDGATRRTYTIVLERTSAALASLVTSTGVLIPSFDPDVLEYEVAPALAPAEATVTPTALDPAASLSVVGTAVASGATSAPIVLFPGSTGVEVQVTARDASTRTYTLTFARRLAGGLSPTTPSDVDANDEFGRCLAMSGDTVVVGAPLEDGDGSGPFDNTAPAAGAAYVFVRSGVSWPQQAYLKAGNVEGGDQFGTAVAIDGDTLVVSAMHEAGDGSGPNDNSESSAGAAYVFVRSGTTWTQQAYLKANDAESTDWFGFSVAISGDTIVVGAPYEDGSNSRPVGNWVDDSGAAYVFTRSGTTWTQQARLKASNVDVADHFGTSVAIDGDRVAVGAIGEDGDGSDEDDDSALQSGAAYVFVREGTTWSQEAYAKATNTGAGDSFGQSVSLSGDTLLVGAPYEDGDGADESDNSKSAAGAAYVFTRSGTTWSQQAYLKASNIDASDWFGFSVSISDEALVVGAHWEASRNYLQPDDNSEPVSGAAYVFLRHAGSWGERHFLKALPTAEAGAGFGFSVAIDGAHGGAVAPWETGSGGEEKAGRLYVFR